MMKNQKGFRNLLIVQLVFLGIGAVAGGFTLIISPSGKLLGIPISILSKTPFTNFLIPGIILFSIIGVVPLLIAFALINKPNFKLLERINLFNDLHWSWTFTIYSAFSLIIWIQIEMAMIESISWIHSFYMFYAISILLVALLPQVRYMYKR